MDPPCTCLTLISKAPLLYFMKHYSVKMHAFLGNANALRIGGHGSEVLLFTMQPPSKIKSPSYSTIDYANFNMG
jgi:hypothetical protein